MITLAARWILPITGPPIQGGWIRLQNQRIVEVSRARQPADAVDLGDVAILPGLVNAHTHLEFSDLTQPIGSPGIALTDWISMVIRQRGSVAPELRSQAIVEGIRQSSDEGVRLVGEICTPPSDYPNPLAAPELVAFAEVLGLSGERSDERWKSAILHNERYDFGGWSPHAPYSTTRSTIELCVEASAKSNRPLAMHVAESPAERELLTRGSGAFADTLRAMGVWREDLFPWGDRPFHQLIDQLSRSAHALLVHGNDFRVDEIERLATHRNITVVYCPRTHAFFGYDRHPVAECVAAGVAVALGTDSRASNPDLNLWSEVQYLLNHRTDLAPSDVLRMATVNGADALMRNKYGRIEAGADAGLGIIATDASDIEGVYEACATAAYKKL